MENRVLTEKQIKFIDILPDEILTNFYLAGGTALSAFHIGHRLSRDLNFFTDREEAMPPVEFLRNMFTRLPPTDSIHYQRLYAHRMFVVTFGDGDILNVEFTIYPFKDIEKRIKIGKLTVDSPLNIVTGKLFAVADRYDPKDFVDLYFGLRTYGWNPGDVIKMTGERFETRGLESVIPERLLLAKRIGPADLPIMLEDLDLEDMKTFFLGQASELVKSLRKG